MLDGRDLETNLSGTRGSLWTAMAKALFKVEDRDSGEIEVRRLLEVVRCGRVDEVERMVIDEHDEFE